MAKRQNVVKMSRSHNLNIGVVIFLIIIIYVVFNVFSYLTSSPIAEYEVGQGTIATNHVYQGLIIRDETVVYAGQSGYINYYMKNASKASVNDVIYSIDTTGDISKQKRHQIKLKKANQSPYNTSDNCQCKKCVIKPFHVFYLLIS